MDRVYRAGLCAQFYTTCKIVAASLDDRPCRRERREGDSVRALVAQSTIEPKAGEANLPTNHFGSDIAAASGRISVVSLSSFRVYRRFLRSLRSDQGRGASGRAPRVAAVSIRVLDFRRRNTGSGSIIATLEMTGRHNGGIARRRRSRPAAAVFVVDPAAGLGAQIECFAARFGLTIAETRVLGEIIGGNGLLAAATKLKITEATARSHANHILAKTGTSRQTELIRRFFETALPGVAASA
jgi:DNA-binding CsgD family transcriptional regulator